MSVKFVEGSPFGSLARLLRNGILAASCFLVSPAAAQVPCPPPPGTAMDSCLAGAWIGSNNAIDQLRAAFTRMGMADSFRDLTLDMAHILAIRIYEDGFYATIPFNRNIEVQEVQESTGDLHISRFDLRVNTETGHMWTTGNQLKFCSNGGGALLGATLTTPDGSKSATLPVTGGASTFVPPISYSCSAESLSMTVALPQPLGNIEYFLTRVNPDRFPEELSEILRPAGE